MSEKQTLSRFCEKLAQRTPHGFLVETIFSRQECKTVGLEVNQRVAHDQCAAVLRIIDREFAVGCAFNFDDVNSASEQAAGFYSRESRGFLAQERFFMSHQRDPEPLRKLI